MTQFHIIADVYKTLTGKVELIQAFAAYKTALPFVL
jgi:hypothetical protein